MLSERYVSRVVPGVIVCVCVCERTRALLSCVRVFVCVCVTKLNEGFNPSDNEIYFVTLLYFVITIAK